MVNDCLLTSKTNLYNFPDKQRVETLLEKMSD